jgi:hypothetical protein
MPARHRRSGLDFTVRLVDVHFRKSQYLANKCRQPRTDKLKLLKPYFPRSISHGLHRGASKYVYDPPVGIQVDPYPTKGCAKAQAEFR